MDNLVQKFDSGGTPQMPEVRLIKRGNEDIDLDKYIKNLEYNVNSYMSSRRWKDKEKDAFMSAYRDMLDGYNKGTLTPGLGNRTVDSTGRLKNSTGKGFDAYRQAQNFFNMVLLNLSVYRKPEDKTPKSRYESAKGIGSELNKILFGGREEFDKNFLHLDDDYSDETKKRGTKARAEKMSAALTDLIGKVDAKEIYADNTDSETARLKSNISKLLDVLKDGKIDNVERLHLSNLGIDPDLYFYTGKSYDTGGEETEQNEPEKSERDLALEEIAAMDEQKQTEALKTLARYKKLLDPQLEILFSEYKQMRSPFTSYKMLNDRNKEDYLKYLDNIIVDFENYLKNNDIYSKGDNFWNSKWNNSGFITTHLSRRNNDNTRTWALDPNWTNRLAFSFLLNNYINGFGGLKTAQGHLIVGSKDGYATLIDPTSGKIYKTPVASLGDEILAQLPELQSAFSIQSNKNGGILKALFGANVQRHDITADLLLYKEQQEALRREQLEADITASGKTKEEYERDLQKLFGEGSTEWSYADKARAASIIGDIGSLVAAFAPGAGTIASASIGAASTLASFTADISEGHGWDAVKGLGMGLGMDALGLIPGLGSGAKTAKMIKTAVKLLPKVMAASTLLDANVQKSLLKLTTDPKNINVADWRNIAVAFKAASGISSNAVIGAKRSAMKYGATKNTTSSVSLKTKTGEIKVGTGKGELNPADFERIKSSGNLEDALKILNGIKGFENIKLKGTKLGKIPGITLKVSNDSFVEQTANTYDFSNVSGSKFSRFGSLDNWWSDVSLYNKHINAPFNGPKSFSFMNPFVWGMRLKNPITPTTSSIVSTPTVITPTTPRIIRPITPGNGPTARSVNLWRTINQAKSKGYRRDFAIGDGRNLREINLGIEFDKKGGVIGSNSSYVPFILKGQGGLDTNWLIANIMSQPIFDTSEANKTKLGETEFNRQKEEYNKKLTEFNNLVTKGHNLGNQGYSYANSIEKLDRDEPLYHDGTTTRNTTLQDAYNVLQNYYKSGNLWKDVESFRNEWMAKNPGKSDLDFRKAYNDLVKSVRSFKKQNYNQAYDSRGWSQFNDDFLSIYRNYNKFDPNQKDIYGKNTFERLANTFKDDNEYKLYRSGKIGNTEMYMDNLGLLQVRETDPLKAKIDATALIPKPGLPNPDIKLPSTEIEGGGDDGEKGPNDGNKWGILQLLYPNLFGAGRLINTLGGNRKIYDIMNRSIKPMLWNTYELYSPITGAFAELSYAFLLAADARRRAAKPFTSDASLTLFGNLEANKLAQLTEWQGKLLHTLNIRQSKNEALKRQEDNIARRTDLANKNRLSIHDTNEKKAQLKADYKLKQINALNNFLVEKLNQAILNMSDYRTFVQQSKAQEAELDYKQKVGEARTKLSNFILAHADDPNFNYKTTPEWSEYLNTINTLERERAIQPNKTLAQLMGWPYLAPSSSSTWSYRESN